MTFSNIALIPTGDELIAGTIIDTDSPMILSVLLALTSNATITRHAPVRDDETTIIASVRRSVAVGTDLIILIGGSGGGHRFVPELGKDYTQSALEQLLTDKHTTELYGKNGHLWCKLLCGYIEKTLIINLPGPYDEAHAAIKAFTQAWAADIRDLTAVNQAMAEAVRACYG